MSKAQLHSRYNPQSEAARYIDSLNLKESIECFILIEPGQGYLIPVLREKFKQSKILALHVEDQADSFSQADFSLTGGDSLKIQEFLETHIRQDAKNIKIIEWRPSLNHYREAYLNILSEVAQFLKRLEAGKRTQAAFGKRWVRNFFRNLGNINTNLLYKQSSIPVIVTGSGPSLEQAIPLIKKAQDTCLLIASSSSLLALAASGVKADIVIATDGGNWALKHLYPLYRTSSSAGLAVNLCAALPSQAALSPQLLINDGSFWQSVVLHELSLPSVIIGQRGTVTATAVELALILSSANIYLAGMDLAVKDIRTHVRPYSFDALFFNQANRITPFYSQCYSRSSLLSRGGSMDIYASWFKSQKNRWLNRIFSIGGGNVFEDAKEMLDREIGVKRPDSDKSSYFKSVNCGSSSGNFCKRGVSALFSAIKEPEYANNIKQELTSLLFYENDKPAEHDIENALKQIAGDISFE
ncbi:MAG: DUF115 domain-containing protein [Treponema sp.]|nr:DUF115 domain-containing protein [Treponema sp.]